tara:strand:+ start:9934 stop:10317 length:384 start_codon:yes stop_codon:yes gene_type:complete
MFGSFVDVTLLTGSLLTIMVLGKSACYKNANIGSLSVNELIVNDLKVNGNCDTPSNSVGSTDNSVIDNIIKELEILRQENKILKERLDNLKINDLIDVDTVGREEDGAFIGWASTENSWVPYPEVGN